MWVHIASLVIYSLSTNILSTYPKSGAVVRTGYSAAPFSIELAGDSEYLVHLFGFVGVNVISNILSPQDQGST